MSRKSLILCLAVLFAMLLALGVAVAFLYSGTGSGSSSHEVDLDGDVSCLAAVPSDAVLAACFSRSEKACESVLSSFAFPDSLYAEISGGSLSALKRRPMSVSLHYSGKLIPLYVFDVEGVSDIAADMLLQKASSLGFVSLKDGSFVLVSESEALVKSASRHLETGVSITDAPGFADALESVGGDMLVFVPHLHARKLLSAVGGRPLVRHSSFVERLSDWSAYEITEFSATRFSACGAFVHDGDVDEFLTALEDCTPSSSQISEVLPSYTISAVSVPVSDNEKYVSAYRSFVDSRQSLHDFSAKQRTLGKSSGIMPDELFKTLDVKEIANATFKVDGKVEQVNLIRVGNRNVELIFKGTDLESLRGYVPAVHQWAYPEFAASVFGSLFSLDDESCFAFVNGWIVTGSQAAVEEYVVRKALDYNLSSYLSDAGCGDLLSRHQSLALIYCSLTEDKDALIADLKPVSAKKLAGFMESEFAPAVLSVGKDKSGLTLSAEIYGLALKKTKAPEFERDTTVIVPSGPFKVKNSHTGKMNTFYQNSQNAICLRDENGKDLWGVPLGKKICGAASNVDYYANGKLQIAFGAGSQIYLIDRLGRYVNGFPVDLGKEILIGPSVYDFSGARKYNILVLHKDNTVDMYNLKGKKPDAWKTIAPSETIKALPERLTLSGNDFWVVRTSIQTLIYPFYGGEPLTKMEGDSKIRPDSQIRVVDAASVEVCCYDGRLRTIKLK